MCLLLLPCASHKNLYHLPSAADFQPVSVWLLGSEGRAFSAGLSAWFALSPRGCSSPSSSWQPDTLLWCRGVPPGFLAVFSGRAICLWLSTPYPILSSFQTLSHFCCDSPQLKPCAGSQLQGHVPALMLTQTGACCISPALGSQAGRGSGCPHPVVPESIRLGLVPIPWPSKCPLLAAGALRGPAPCFSPFLGSAILCREPAGCYRQTAKKVKQQEPVLSLLLSIPGKILERKQSTSTQIHTADSSPSFLGA